MGQYHFINELLKKLKNSSLHVRMVIVSGLAMALFLSAHYFESSLPALERWIQGLGAWAPLVFISLFVLLTPLFFSVDALCLAAGIMFPLFSAILYVAIGTYLAAGLIFLLGRYLFRDKVETLLSGQNKFAVLDAVLSENEFKLMFLLRLTPLPFALLSYAFSVTKVQFSPFLYATSGIFIYQAALVYFGYTTKHIAASVGTDPQSGLIHGPLLIGGLIITPLILAHVIRTARDAINKLAPQTIKLDES